MKTLKSIWQKLSADEKRAMALRLDTSTAYLSQIAHGHRNAGKYFKVVVQKDINALEKKLEAA